MQLRIFVMHEFGLAKFDSGIGEQKYFTL